MPERLTARCSGSMLSNSGQTEPCVNRATRLFLRRGKQAKPVPLCELHWKKERDEKHFKEFQARVQRVDEAMSDGFVYDPPVVYPAKALGFTDMDPNDGYLGFGRTSQND